MWRTPYKGQWDSLMKEKMLATKAEMEEIKIFEILLQALISPSRFKVQLQRNSQTISSQSRKSSWTKEVLNSVPKIRTGLGRKKMPRGALSRTFYRDQFHSCVTRAAAPFALLSPPTYCLLPAP